MNNPIYLVDDDPIILESVSWLLQGEGFEVTCFSSHITLLETIDASLPGVVVLDINMPSMDGMELHRKINSRNSVVAVLFLTGHADVSLTKQAFKQGATDLLQKPVNADELLSAIRAAQKLSNEQYCIERKKLSLKAKLEFLTAREMELLPLIIKGLPNKIIADRLCLALRTVEIHRHNVFKKMGVTSGIQLAYLGKDIDGLVE